MRSAPSSSTFLAIVIVGAPAGGTTIDVFTIGPAGDLSSRWGHTLACTLEEGAADGACYDYGIPDTEDWAWGSYRGRACFGVRRFAASEILESYRVQERNIERQRLPLSELAARNIADALARDVSRRIRYAYHPYHANCTTKIRDHIDQHAGGRLRAHERPTLARRTPLFRQASEGPLAGRVVELGLLALTLGPSAERRPTTWEAQFVPTGLRDAIRERFGVEPEIVHDRTVPALPLTTHGGRIVVALAGVALALLLLRGARGSDARYRRWRLAIGVALGLAGVVVYFVALTCAFPEFRRNWALLVLVPTDLALGWLAGRRLLWYVATRLAIAGAVLAGGLLQILHQPLAAPVALAALPLLVLLSREVGIVRGRLG